MDKNTIIEIEKYYDILKNGCIVRKDSKTKLNSYLNSYGYLSVYIKELKIRLYVHRIVLMKYKYIDGCKTNNDISNLEWLTIKDNIRKSRKYSKHENIVMLSDNEIVDIYNKLIDGYKVSTLCSEYNVSKSTVLNIKFKRTHKDILSKLENIGSNEYKTDIPKEKVLEIKRLLEDGVKPSEISKITKINQQFIIDFKFGKICKNICPKNCKKFLGGEKLTENQVIDIINDYNDGKEYDYLSEKYGVTVNSIKNILNRKTWKYLTNNMYIKNKVQRLSLGGEIPQ